jgi:hypothetical protein
MFHRNKLSPAQELVACSFEMVVICHTTQHILKILFLIFHVFCCRSGRFAAEPIGGLTSLKGEPPGPGFGVRSDL